MPLILTALFGWLSSLLGRFFSDTLLKFLAYKVLFFTLITVTIPIVAKNLITWLFKTLTETATAHVNTDGIHAVALHLSGVAGYLASHLMLADCLSVIITAITIRFALNFIPFIG